jgi:hypothetical protein
MCSECDKYSQQQKPTVRIKAASSYRRERKLSELYAIIKGVSYPGISYVDVRKTKTTNAKGASSQLERQFKLKELGKMIKGL